MDDDTRAPEPVAAALLRRSCDPAALGFGDTDELAGADMPGGPAALGQGRAVEAIDLGARMTGRGFNLFVMGSPGSGARRLTVERLAARATAAPSPSDWVYVNNFAEPGKPVALELPPGRATQLRDAMAELIDDLSAALPALFEGEDYRNRRDAIEEDIRHRQEAGFEALAEEARGRGATILRTPMGFSVAPLKDGRVVTPEEFQALPKEEQERVHHEIAEIQDKLQALMRAMPGFEKERRAAVRDIDHEVAEVAVGHSVNEIAARFQDLPQALDWLEQARAALIERAGLFLAADPDAPPGAPVQDDGRFTPFRVNVLVSRDPTLPGAPLVAEDHPTLQNLLGRVEHVPHQGALVTNFTLIQPGALHRANGGFLVLDARQLLAEPFAWAALKRTLRAGAIRIVAPAEYLGFAATVSLEPEPIPLGVKVVILGERLHYYMLLELDHEMRELFKLVADVDDAMDRDGESERGYARLMGALARLEGLRPIDAEGAARLIDFAAREAGDAGKLSLEIETVADRLREADHYAEEAGLGVIGAAQIDRAVAAEIRRSDRLRQRAQEAILREVALIDTDGAAVGCVNGLSVSQIGGFAFGRPTRITARVRAGAGRVVDIEREVELGGALHSKGVMILTGLLGGRYAAETPLALSASIVFEQSYGGVDGDSASSAEFYALVSAIAEEPLRQDLAVTGSVNQHGRVQAIGGVNEKIEGFFDICAARGLTGRQGVLIPRANVQHLMLRPDVAAACAEGRFAVWPIDTVDQGLTLLTGQPAGARDPDGAFAEGTIDRRVEDRLKALAEARRRMGEETQETRT